MNDLGKLFTISYTAIGLALGVLYWNESTEHYDKTLDALEVSDQKKATLENIVDGRYELAKASDLKTTQPLDYNHMKTQLPVPGDSGYYFGLWVYVDTDSNIFKINNNKEISTHFQYARDIAYKAFLEMCDDGL